MAGKREIIDFVAPAVLLGDYVFDVEAKERSLLGKPAVLAAFLCSGTNVPSGRDIH